MNHYLEDPILKEAVKEFSCKCSKFYSLGMCELEKVASESDWTRRGLIGMSLLGYGLCLAGHKDLATLGEGTLGVVAGLSFIYTNN